MDMLKAKRWLSYDAGFGLCLSCPAGFHRREKTTGESTYQDRHGAGQPARLVTRTSAVLSWWAAKPVVRGSHPANRSRPNRVASIKRVVCHWLVSELQAAAFTRAVGDGQIYLTGTMVPWDVYYVKRWYVL